MIGAISRILGITTKRSVTWALAIFALTAGSAAAQTISVYPGCDVPKPSERGRTFYVDPVHGSPANDGSKERPWQTLAEVVNPANHLIATRSDVTGPDPGRARETQPINPQGPIKPGDTIVLMSGDHGVVEVPQYINSDFISVVAGLGETPIVRAMHVVASSHWLFRGVKFQSAQAAISRTSRLSAWLATIGSGRATISYSAATCSRPRTIRRRGARGTGSTKPLATASPAEAGASPFSRTISIICATAF